MLSSSLRPLDKTTAVISSIRVSQRSVLNTRGFASNTLQRFYFYSVFSLLTQSKPSLCQGCPQEWPSFAVYKPVHSPHCLQFFSKSESQFMMGEIQNRTSPRSSMDQWALSREIICSLLPCLHQEVHLLLKQVVLFFLATFWMLGETPSPLCTPSCSLFLLLPMQAWQGSASARSILHSFGTQTKCYVLTGLCTAEKENSLKWVQIHGVDWFFCVCSSKKPPFSSSEFAKSL